MTFLRLLLFVALPCLISSCTSTSPNSTLATATKVDPQRYVGRWYEIARFPMSFQKAEEKAYAEYAQRPDGKIAVHNVATARDGSQRDIKGSATILNPGDNSRLNVRFDEWFSLFIPNKEEGNYWILHVDADYTEALVGTPDRKYLWILARKPELTATAYQRLVDKAKALGFETQRLIRPGT
jgi:apolipoprotein D and lipocalin family protein